MKCLFAFPDAPLSENYSGAAVRYLASFLALTKLGVEVNVWRPLEESLSWEVLELDKADLSQFHSKDLAKIWKDAPYQRSVPEGFSVSFSLINHLAAFLSPLLQPEKYFFPSLSSLVPSFLELIRQTEPDFIWAETAFVACLVRQVHPRLPWVYQHHDWAYKIQWLRHTARRAQKQLSFRLSNAALRRLEQNIARASHCVLTGSASEAAEICQAGQPNVFVIPTTYQPVDLPLDALPAQPVRIVHLGSLRTTANYLGLKAYLQTVHPRVVALLAEQKIPFEFVLVGDSEDAKPELLELLHRNQATLLGFQSDLGSILRPFDIAIIPYSENTGTRTKLPLLMNYAQVVLATESAVAGTPEIRGCSGCIITKDLEGFVEPLLLLARQANLRQIMGQEARIFFNSHFTIDSQLACYQAVVDKTLRERFI